MRKSEIRALLFAVLILIGIGYASIRSGLNINGITHVNTINWDVHFENYQATSNSNVTPTTLPVIGVKTTTISYSVVLTNPGDVYEFTLDVVNAGLVDVMIDSFSSKLNNVEINNNLPDYLTYSATYSDGIDLANKQRLLHNTSETLKLKLGYRDDIPNSSLPQSIQNLTVDFMITYVQADSSAIPVRGGPDNFTTDDWDTIIDAVQNNNISAYNVGDTKTLDMGSLGTYTIRIANKDTPSECSGEGFSQTACGFVLEFVDLAFKQAFYDADRDNSVGWTNSTIRSYINTTMYNSLPTNVKNAVMDTYVVSGYGKDGSSNFVTTDKMYLLSTKEIYGEAISGRDTVTETRQLKYYYNQNTTTSSHDAAIKKQDNNAKVWWLRSADHADNKDFLHVSISGDYGDSNSDNPNYISVAFRLKNTTS